MTLDFFLSLTLSKSVHKNSMLRKHLTAWRGRDFTDAELADFAVSKILGVPATVTVTHRTSNGRTYASITAIAKAMKGAEAKASRRVYFDLQDDSTFEAVKDLPGWVVQKINSSTEARQSHRTFAKTSA